MTPLALPPIRKTVMLPSFRSGRVECWEATTVDGEWTFVREESSGTPWLLFHEPSVRDGSYNLPVQMCGTLRACRQSVAQGWARQHLAAHKAEEAERL